MYSTGLVTFSELQNNQGRLDTICIAHKSIYIFEFKINETAEAALKQIQATNYALPFLTQDKNIYLIGVNFMTEGKKINDVLVEKWNGQQFERLHEAFTLSI